MFVNGSFQSSGGIFGVGTSTDTANIQRGADGSITIRPRSGLFGSGSGNDQVHVQNLGNGMYGVTVNGQLHQFTREEMSRLKIETGAGDDQVVVDPGMDLPVAIDAGAGNDRVYNRSNGVTIDGGAGNDLVASWAHGCRINGGTGNDALFARGACNSVLGGGGWDRLGVLGLGNLTSCGAAFSPFGALVNTNAELGPWGVFARLRPSAWLAPPPPSFFWG